MTPRVEFHLEAAGPFPDLKRLERLARFVLTAEGAEAEEVGIALTDDAGIQALNRDYLGRDEPTDVLAFGLAEEAGGRPALVVGAKGRPYLGDVAISLERARQQAPAYSHSWEEECETLLVHGLLHLLGYDDGTEAERRRMEARQNRLLASFEHPRTLLSFRAAFVGLGSVIRTQRNMVIHLGAAILVVVAGALLGFALWEWAVLLLTIALVLVTETFNTALEVLVDLASPEKRLLARRAKDLAAAAVFLAALFSVAVGAVLFLPHLKALLGK